MKTQKETTFFNSLDQFRLTPKMHKWMRDGYQPSAFFIGPGGIGKTVFVRMLANLCGWKILHVRYLTDLKNYDETYDAIFFDNFIFKGLTHEELLALIDTTEPQTIDATKSTMTKKAALIRIFEMNPNSFERFVRKIKGGKSELGNEYARRMVVFFIDETFIKEPTKNLDLNVHPNYKRVIQHTDIYNNSQNIAENKAIARNISTSARR